jgi:uncharacterized protein
MAAARLHAVGFVGVAVVLVGIAVVVSCRSTDDPRAGSLGGTSGGNGTSSSGGIDAAPPESPIACGAAPAAAPPFTKQALLGAAADCAAWHACTFLNAANALRTSVRDHGSAPSEAKVTAARTAWKTAMDEWSKVELFQFGPAGSKSIDPYYGRGLRTFVHPWPQTSRCEVEKQIATKEWREAGIGAVLPSGRGLFAVEYVFFYPGADTACLAGSPTGQAWGALGAADLAKAKSDYAVAVADNILALGLELRNVWLPEGENFKAKLLALEGYGSDQEALNVVGWSLFYIEKDVKDLKLASRAGVEPTAPNPETPFALVEIENIRTNLRAFRSLFEGCGTNGAGIGFDDWLVSAGHQTLANDITTALANAQAAADAFPAFAQANETQFRSLYEAVRVLTNLLKTNLFGSASPLNLKLPAGVASDTD